MGPVLRPFEEADRPGLAEVISTAMPSEPQTEPSLRTLDAYLEQRGLSPSRIVADEDGRLVGHGILIGRGATASVEVGVVPDARRRGLGTALLEELARRAKANGSTALRTRWVAESAAPAVAFLARHGFRELERAWPSSLDLAAFDPSRHADGEARLAAEGLVVTTLAAEGTTEAVLRRVLALHDACVRDIPRLDPHESVSFEAWRTWMVDSPNALPEAFFLAVDGGAYVGMSVLDRGGPAGGVHQGFTGVLPSHRGRGIARALKLRAIGYARAHGYAAIHTRQHAANAPMLALNAQLGFARGPAEIRFEKALAE